LEDFSYRTLEFSDLEKLGENLDKWRVLCHYGKTAVKTINKDGDEHSFEFIWSLRWSDMAEVLDRKTQKPLIELFNEQAVDRSQAQANGQIYIEHESWTQRRVLGCAKTEAPFHRTVREKQNLVDIIHPALFPEIEATWKEITSEDEDAMSDIEAESGDDKSDENDSTDYDSDYNETERLIANVSEKPELPRPIKCAKKSERTEPDYRAMVIRQCQVR
jgi:hypothetical protein